MAMPTHAAMLPTGPSLIGMPAPGPLGPAPGGAAGLAGLGAPPFVPPGTAAPLAGGAVASTGTAGASLPQVRVTEADRVAWMRQFLHALEQWKSVLDSQLPGPGVSIPTTQAAEGPPAEGRLLAPLVTPPAGTTVAAPGPASAGGGGDPNAALAVYAATAQAQQAQYMQQYQFWQQMRMHEAQRVAKGGQVVLPPSQSMTRFKDNFRPMRLCKHLTTMGYCRQGDQCTFAHNYEELHVSSADLPKAIEDKAFASVLVDQASTTVAATSSDSNNLPDLRLKKKKELCGRFARGYCSLGKVCSFAHGEDELNTVGLAVCGKVKTQLCRNWEAGRCIYGANCNNAHGDQEIGTRRPPPELAPPSKRRRDDEALGAGERSEEAGAASAGVEEPRPAASVTLVAASPMAEPAGGGAIATVAALVGDVQVGTAPAA